MYCMSCQKEYEHEMFCPECGRMLVGNNTFDYQKNDNREKTYYEEQRERAKQIQQRKIEAIRQQQECDKQNLPKCPTCSSTNIEKISSLDKAAGAVMFGLFSKTARSQFKCKNCGYKW